MTAMLFELSYAFLLNRWGSTFNFKIGVIDIKKNYSLLYFYWRFGTQLFQHAYRKKLWFTPMEWNIIFPNNRKSNRPLTDCPNLFWIWLSFAAPTFDLALMLRQAIHADFPIAIASLFSNIWICTILVPS